MDRTQTQRRGEEAGKKASVKSPGWASTVSTNTRSLDTLGAGSEDEPKSLPIYKVHFIKVIAENQALKPPDQEVTGGGRLHSGRRDKT